MRAISEKIYDFGIRLQELREEKKLTQKAVAQIIGVHINTIGAYENNTRFPKIKNLKKLAILYSVSLDYLFDFEDRACIYIDDLSPENQALLKSFLKMIRKE